jgi:hypothetical protein
MVQRRTNIVSALYWAGVILSVACVGLVLTGKPASASQLPLSWLAGIFAVLAFLSAEWCNSLFAASKELQRPESTPSVESWRYYSALDEVPVEAEELVAQ